MALTKTAATPTITAPTSRSAPTRVSRSTPGFHPKNSAERRVESHRSASRILIVDDDVRLASMLEFLRRLKKKGSVPVLTLTALADEQDRILALELGADDYLLKPFMVRELGSFLRALLRQCVNARPDSTPFALGALAIDPGTMSAALDGVPVRLTTAEFMLLETLARSAGRIQSRETLTHQALGRTLEPFDRS